MRELPAGATEKGSSRNVCPCLSSVEPEARLMQREQYAPVGQGQAEASDSSGGDSEGAIPPQKPARSQRRATATAESRPGPSQQSGHSMLCLVGTALVVIGQSRLAILSPPSSDFSAKQRSRPL
jgi:hypothetical protein